MKNFEEIRKNVRQNFEAIERQKAEEFVERIEYLIHKTVYDREKLEQQPQAVPLAPLYQLDITSIYSEVLKCSSAIVDYVNSELKGQNYTLLKQEVIVSQVTSLLLKKEYILVLR